MHPGSGVLLLTLNCPVQHACANAELIGRISRKGASSLVLQGLGVDMKLLAVLTIRQLASTDVGVNDLDELIH